jgi:hypothetical protein
MFHLEFIEHEVDDLLDDVLVRKHSGRPLEVRIHVRMTRVLIGTKRACIRRPIHLLRNSSDLSEMAIARRLHKSLIGCSNVRIYASLTDITLRASFSGFGSVDGFLSAMSLP